MKISTEQLRALQEIEVNKAKEHKASGDFGELLTRQLDAGQQPAALEHAAAPQPAVLLPLSGVTEDSALSSAPFEEAATMMDGMFNTLEQYAGQLAQAENPDMRAAYATLENMRGQIADFKSRYPNAAEEQPGLAAMVNELDVLATTEVFKFNRGDYL